MRALRAWCVLGGLAVGACLDIPAHQGPIDAPVDAPSDASVDAPPCGADPDDCDDDGWVRDATNPAADDCNDFNPAINPGASDDPATGVDEDCIAGAGTRLVGVTGDQAGWTSGGLAIAFGSVPRMPMTLTLNGSELLGQELGQCRVANEEGLGISLFPVFAAHLNTAGPVGDLMVERHGPALATSVVTWSQSIAGSGVGDRCDRGVTLTAELRFTMLPGQRLVRHDRVMVTVDGAAPREVASCVGCAAGGGNAPVFTSYLTLHDEIDRMSINGGAAADFAPRSVLATQPVCVWQRSGPSHVAVAWSGQGAGARVRRTTGNSVALVFDWVFNDRVPQGTYDVVTSMVFDGMDGDACRPELRDSLDELRVPPLMNGLRFVPELGAYEPSGIVSGGEFEFQALAAVERGLAVRVPILPSHGVTVWRRPSNGAYTRLARDFQYLIQQDPDGALVLWLPGLGIGDFVRLAEPGHEPAP